MIAGLKRLAQPVGKTYNSRNLIQVTDKMGLATRSLPFFK